jgi:hypothetical protein
MPNLEQRQPMHPDENAPESERCDCCGCDVNDHADDCVNAPTLDECVDALARLWWGEE